MRERLAGWAVAVRAFRQRWRRAVCAMRGHRWVGYAGLGTEVGVWAALWVCERCGSTDVRGVKEWSEGEGSVVKQWDRPERFDSANSGGG